MQIDSKFHNKQWCPFFHYEDFYLKTSFISALMNVVIFFSLVVSTVVLFTRVFSKPVYDVLVHSKKKKIWTTCTFASFGLNFIVFLSNGLKQSLFFLEKIRSLHCTEIARNKWSAAIFSFKREIKLMSICLWKFVFVGLIPLWIWKVKLHLKITI